MKRASVRAWLATAAVCVLAGLGVAWAGGMGGCAESAMKKEIAAHQAEAATADTAAAAAAKKKADLDAAVSAAKEASTGPDGTVDLARQYAELVKRVQAMEETAAGAADAAAIAAKVAAGKTPEQAGLDLAAQAAVDAKKFADDAKAARDAAAAAAAKIPAAHEADTASWTSGIRNISTVADLFWPGVGALAGGIGLMVVNKARGKTFADGQEDGAAQVAQGIATIRKASPAVDSALKSVGPVVKTLVATLMDDHVAAVVAANRDTPIEGSHGAIADGPATTALPAGATTA